MGKRISQTTRRELLEGLRGRYHGSQKMDKKRILDEFVAITGYHRKHAVRLIGRSHCRTSTPVHAVGSRRIYDEAVKEALIVLWEASDRICGKRLKAILPELLDAMERQGHVCGFGGQLPELWREGEVRPTHRIGSKKPHQWRTRKDPFAEVWYEVLCMLQQDADVTAKSLFERLQHEYPGHMPTVN